MEKLKEKYDELEQKYVNLNADYLKVKYELEQLKRHIFGRRSERYVPPSEPADSEQINIPIELENSDNSEKSDVKKTSSPASEPQKKKGHGRGKMPTNLPVVEIVLEPNFDVSNLRKIGEEISWEFDWIPGQLTIRKYIRPKYVNDAENELITAPLPKRFTEKGNFSETLAAYIVVEKYLYHMPLYRIIQKFNREYSIEFAASTLSDVISQSAFWLESIYYELKKKLITASYVQADETTMKVLCDEKKGTAHTGYFWAYHDPLNQIVLFDYQKGRHHDNPQKFLHDFAGILQADGYQAYDKMGLLEGVERASCMAHVRRYFEKALSNDEARSSYALGVIKEWFMVERKAKDLNLNSEERLKLRKENGLEKSFDDFREWLLKTAMDTAPKDPIRRACEYTLGQWKGFDSYLSDGRVELSTNLLEAQIRPIALGRKNYLFTGSHEAAQKAAMIYSIIATAKANGIEPHSYIQYLLTELPKAQSNDIEYLLPYNYGNSEIK